jgi:hypothetical protein
MGGKYSTAKDLEAWDLKLIEALSRQSPGVTEKNQEILSQDGRCPYGDSNLTAPECKSGALPLRQLALCKRYGLCDCYYYCRIMACIVTIMR